MGRGYLRRPLNVGTYYAAERSPGRFNLLIALGAFPGFRRPGLCTAKKLPQTNPAPALETGLACLSCQVQALPAQIKHLQVWEVAC